MEAGGLVEVMAMAEGALFRYGKTGDRYEAPCWAMGGCSVNGHRMAFQMAVMGGEKGPCSAGAAESEPERAEVSIRMDGDGAPSWELWVTADGKWDGRLYSGGRTLLAREWEVDGAIEKAVRRRNAALE